MKKIYWEMGGDGICPVYWTDGMWILPDGRIVDEEDDDDNTSD